MKVTIGGIDVSKVITNVALSEAATAESVVTTLSGNVLVDRYGSLKTTVTLQVGNLPYKLWQKIRLKLWGLPVIVEISAEGSYKMALSGALPSPKIYTLNGVDYCTGGEVTLTEVG